MLIECASPDEAISVAEKFRSDGVFNYFRGQRSDWLPQPTIHRPGVDKEAARSRLERLAAWIATVPELQSLHGNYDGILAVAQHYGIPTPFLDVTTSPLVAAFFAMHSEEPPEDVVQPAAFIYCFNSIELEEQWRSINDGFRRDHQRGLVRLVTPSVPNLWRLSAQHGSFIDMRVEPTAFTAVTPYAVLKFRPTPIDPLLKHSIYPTRKSHIEQLLEHFFLIESYPERWSNLGSMFSIDWQTHKTASAAMQGANEKFAQPQTSWQPQNIAAWLKEPSEAYNEARLVRMLSVDRRLPVRVLNERIREQIEFHFQMVPDLRSSPTVWRVLDVETKAALTIDDDLADLGDVDNDDPPQIDIDVFVNDIFDSMRRLPYSTYDVILAMTHYISIAATRGHDSMEELWGQVIGIEFSNDGIRGRGFASEAALLNCVRDDLLDASPSARQVLPHIRELLIDCTDPSRLFDFNKLSRLFAAQVIPTHVLIRIEPVSLFNPATLKAFGIS